MEIFQQSIKPLGFNRIHITFKIYAISFDWGFVNEENTRIYSHYYV